MDEKEALKKIKEAKSFRETSQQKTKKVRQKKEKVRIVK